MKRAKGLFEEAVTFSNLLRSYQKARSGTRKTVRVCAFGFQLEPELFRLREELLDGSYQPRPYRHFEVRDPKRRIISVADFRDRVVHHAVVAMLEPLYERCFITDSYATRKGKGAHAAVFRAQQYLRRNGWFLKTDIHKYFDSIRHDILLGQLERKVADQKLLALIARILANGGEAGTGLPIGNLTSQFFANVYLNGFDHWVKERLRVQHYIRYMDDFVLFGSGRQEVKAFRQSVQQELSEGLQLALKPTATFINRRENGLSFLGTRIFPQLIRLHPENARRAARKLAIKRQAFESANLDEASYLQSLNSYCAYFSVYDTIGLRKSILL
jgi:hypothetical protein